MPGYGRSAKHLHQTDPFGYLATTVRGLLDELGVEAAHLVGNSYRGACALRLADNLDDLASFHFDTALSSSAAALPSLLAFAQPGHIMVQRLQHAASRRVMRSLSRMISSG